MSYRIVSRTPCFYWFFVGWDCLSLGLHVSFKAPNIEIHLPFGFIRMGWEVVWQRVEQ